MAPELFPRTATKPIDLDIAPLWQVVLSPDITHPRRILQIPDEETAREFWNIYQPEAMAVEGIFSKFRPLSSKDVALRISSEEWYMHKEHAGSIHGRQHSIRVALYAELLGQMVGLDERQRNILTATAMVHDVGRVNDAEDKSHGERSAKWWDKHKTILESRGISLTDRDKEIVKQLCIYHEVPYTAIPKELGSSIEESQEIHQLLKYFMVADALDRYRSPNEQWWPNAEYFNYDQKIKGLFETLMPFALYFTLATEYYRLSQGKTIEEAVIDIGRNVGLIKKTIRRRTVENLAHLFAVRRVGRPIS